MFFMISPKNTRTEMTLIPLILNFQGLQKVCAKYQATFLIDEVQTGGGPTGKMWAHEYFDLPEAPDMVTFSKKMLTGGIFHKKDLRPKQAYRIFNTWVGDPSE